MAPPTQPGSDGDGPLDDVVRIARAAGELLRNRWGKPGEVRTKLDARHPDAPQKDLVTEVDEAAEGLVARLVFALSPGALLLGEEGGARGADGVLTSVALDAVDDLWVVDPIDGTINFAYDIPMFCVSIARLRRGVIVASAVLAPVTNELFTWDAATGARRNGRPIEVRDRPASDQLLGLGNLPRVKLAPVASAFRGVRHLGSAALDLCYVACGRFGAYARFGDLSAWDIAGAVPIVLAAGGVVTTAQFEPWTLDLTGPTSLVAGVPQVHDELRALLID